MIGYMVSYQEITSFFFDKVPGDNFSETRKTVISKGALIEMLDSSKYFVIDAKVVDGR